MSLGQHLNDVLEPTHVNDVTKTWKTEKRTWPNGRTTAKRIWSAPKREFDVEFDGISLAQFHLIETHFDEHSGGFATFTFTDPHTDAIYTVRYADDELVRKKARRHVRGLYRIRIRLEEHKP